MTAGANRGDDRVRRRRVPPAAILAGLALAVLTGAGDAAPVRAAQPAGPATGKPTTSTRDAFMSRFVGKPAPDFTLGDLNGKDVHLSSLRGKVVLLNFWYSSCPPCRQETPDLVTLHRLHSGQGLEILGINLDDIIMPTAGHGPLKSFLQEFKVPYPVLLADDAVFDLYGGVPVQPITFLVDRQGTVMKIFWGAYPGPAFEKAVLRYLGPPPPRP